MPAQAATPRAQSSTSLSAIDARNDPLGQLQQDRIVDDAAILVGDQHIFALADLAAGKVTASRNWVNFAASGPVISTWRSTATSHRIASFTRFQEILDRVTEVAWNIHVVID